ncbi:hypothetical protein BDV41DRAFT_383740 [Aspergillus transmontanensis]|uniref:Uncharacterized protein n=1 Tax=Aspergillus transmontanensis TaxID=1034304 RepID=A0A5N6VQD1_9EURO|nr:hypothetical protein BDV41DRAFT_383740 [Aspergillus transmontanensis]
MSQYHHLHNCPHHWVSRQDRQCCHPKVCILWDCGPQRRLPPHPAMAFCVPRNYTLPRALLPMKLCPFPLLELGSLGAASICIRLGDTCWCLGSWIGGGAFQARLT